MSTDVINGLPLAFFLLGFIVLLGDVEFWKKRLTIEEKRAKKSRFSLLCFASLLGASASLYVSNIVGGSPTPQLGAPELSGAEGLLWQSLSNFFAIAIFMLLGLGILCLGAQRETERQGENSQFALLLLAAVGGLIAIRSDGLLSFYLGLEIISAATLGIVLTGTSRPNLSEAGMKFFVFSSVGSLLLLFGGALLFGATKQMLFSQINESIIATSSDSASAPILLLGVLLSVCGLLLKAGIAPFHFAFVDAFYGAPLAGRISLNLILRGSALFGLMKLQLVAFADPRLSGEGGSVLSLILAFSVLSIVWGTCVALRQVKFPRTLVWASLVDGGLALLGLVAVASSHSSAPALIYTWSISLSASLGLLLLHEGLTRGKNDDQSNAVHQLTQWQGILQSCPPRGFFFVLFLSTAAALPFTPAFFPRLMLVQGLLSDSKFLLAYFMLGQPLFVCVAYLRVLHAALTKKTRASTQISLQVTALESPKILWGSLFILSLALGLMSLQQLSSIS